MPLIRITFDGPQLPTQSSVGSVALEVVTVGPALKSVLDAERKVWVAENGLRADLDKAFSWTVTSSWIRTKTPFNVPASYSKTMWVKMTPVRLNGPTGPVVG